MTLDDHIAAIHDARYACERTHTAVMITPSHINQSDHNLARQQHDLAVEALADYARSRDCEIERLSLDLREAKARYDEAREIITRREAVIRRLERDIEEIGAGGVSGKRITDGSA